MKCQALTSGLLLLGLVACARPSGDHHGVLISCGNGSVLLTEWNLIRYDWDSHTFWLGPSDHLRLFAASPPKCTVSADGSVLYEADVVSPFDSSSRSSIVFTYTTDPLSPNQLPVEIQLGYPTSAYFSGTDVRSDARLRSALQRADKLSS